VNLLIRGKNVTVPENAKDYITKKVGRFDNHLKNIVETKVEVSREKTGENQYVVEITIDNQGTFIRGERRGADMISAIDAAVDMMDRQISRYKDRFEVRKLRAAASKRENIEAPEKEISQIKVKHFPVKPMSPEEAIDQMELLGHDFFVFFNDTSEQLNVVYRRKAGGTYGLIDPEID
jgi:putative sigma-54 modulation protein